MAEERLQKIMAEAGVASRRKAEDLIAQGRVTINGEIVREMGVKVDPERDRIEVDGQPLSPESKVYLAVHKPEGVVTTVDDPEGRPTILSLIPPELGRVYPVGRLDMDSRGLVILTNDGDLAHKLMHPSFEHEKEYRVKVGGQPGQTAFNQIRQGIMLEDGMTAPADVSVIDRKRDSSWLRVILREGRKRQLRRMFEALEYPVRDLFRTRVGPIQLGTLAEGDWRRLTVREVHALRRVADGYKMEPVAPPMVPNKSLVELATGRQKADGGKRKAEGSGRKGEGRRASESQARRPAARPTGRRDDEYAPRERPQSGRSGPREADDYTSGGSRSGQRPAARPAGRRDEDYTPRGSRAQTERREPRDRDDYTSGGSRSGQRPAARPAGRGDEDYAPRGGRAQTERREPRDRDEYTAGGSRSGQRPAARPAGRRDEAYTPRERPQSGRSGPRDRDEFTSAGPRSKPGVRPSATGSGRTRTEQPARPSSGGPRAGQGSRSGQGYGRPETASRADRPPRGPRPTNPTRRPLRADEEEDDWMQPTDRQRARATGASQRSGPARSRTRRPDDASEDRTRSSRPTSGRRPQPDAPMRGKSATRPGAGPTRTAASGPANRPTKGSGPANRPTKGSGPANRPMKGSGRPAPSGARRSGRR